MIIDLHQKQEKKDNFFLSSKTILWIVKNGKNLLLGLSSSLILLFLIFYVFKHSKKSSYQDYVVSKIAYEKLLKNSEEMHSSLETLEKVGKSHPELLTKFESLLTQRYLDCNKVALAEPHALALFKRAQKDLPLYVEFSRNSLLISKEDYSQALQLAKNLKLQLEENKKQETSLYLYNLLRIAMLEQKLGEKDQEWRAWQDILLNIDEQKNSEVKTQFLENFKDQNLQLMDYIQYRKKILGKNL